MKNSKDNLKHKENIDREGECKISPQPSPKSEIYTIKSLIETGGLILMCESKANNPSSNKKYNDLLIISKLLLILLEPGIDMFSLLMLRNIIEDFYSLHENMISFIHEQFNE